ncbi:MAG: HesA/MoeB/ThiF family protein [Candidatus Omnitrophica bacterium]|nr:HesA/MoeB/ThiF family protein [Candidatus Omnitrophota bacterium]
MGLSKEQIARYSRQLILPEVGVKGQERLKESSVLIVGAGGLGSPAALYLAAAGVGTIGIVDEEAVAIGNLHRQILYRTDEVGWPKSLTAQGRLTRLNSEITVRAIQGRLTAANATELVCSAHIVLDGSDNFATRYLVNDACVLQRKPLIYGGVVRLDGQVLAILPKQSACFRCVFPEPPQGGDIPNCQEAGVLGSCAGVIGTVMAHEALKLLLGFGEALTDRLLVFDGRTSRFRETPVRRNPQCAVCGDHPTITDIRQQTSPARAEPGRADTRPCQINNEEGQCRASK